jgi:hypothetical protein
MKKILILLSIACATPAFAVTTLNPPNPAPGAAKKPVPVVKQLEAACLAKLTPGLGRTRVVDIIPVQGPREKNIHFGLVDGSGRKSARLCEVQPNGSIVLTEVPVKLPSKKKM